MARPNGCLITCNWCTSLCALIFVAGLLVPAVPWGLYAYDNEDGDVVVSELRLTEQCNLACESYQDDDNCDVFAFCQPLADKYLKEMRVVKGLTIAAVISIAMLTLATGTGTCGADTKRRVKAQNYITGLAVLSWVFVLAAALYFLTSSAWKDFKSVSGAYETKVTLPLGTSSCGWAALYLLILFIFSASWRNCCASHDDEHHHHYHEAAPAQALYQPPQGALLPQHGAAQQPWQTQPLMAQPVAPPQHQPWMQGGGGGGGGGGYYAQAVPPPNHSVNPPKY